MDDKVWLDILITNIYDYDNHKFAGKIILLNKKISTYVRIFEKYIKLYYINPYIGQINAEYYIVYRLPNGNYHREEIDSKTKLSLPTLIYEHGAQFWYKNRNIHREEFDPETNLSLPAVIDSDGAQYWYRYGREHRKDRDPKTNLTLPAVIRVNGTQE